MAFNPYIWALYKNSINGKEIISLCKPSSDLLNSEHFSIELEQDYYKTLLETPLKKYTAEGKANFVSIYVDFFRKNPVTLESACEIFYNYITKGIQHEGFYIQYPDNPLSFISDLNFISNALYIVNHEDFFPYEFKYDFDNFQEICIQFNIPLPAVPRKRHKAERFFYYFEICRAVKEFRLDNDLSPEEWCAFLYDFAPNFINSKKNDEVEPKELPAPTGIWYIGVGPDKYDFIDNAISEDVSQWRCNIDTREGDIIIMYAWNPRSSIQSVWRATTNGFIDPFFEHYQIAYISNPVKVPPIAFKEIKSNPVLGKSPIVANSFQGVNGYPITYAEYQEMRRIWQERGMNMTLVPDISVSESRLIDLELKTERDVEIHLIEPLFQKLKYKPDDYTRQMPVRMGRGERIYPDYCFGAVSTHGEEKAKMLVEAKYSIKNQKQLQDAYLQTKSYAYRLLANAFVIASKEGLWIFTKGSKDFSSVDKAAKFSWADTENPDVFKKLLKLIGKN